MRLEDMPISFESGPFFLKIIDFSVEDDLVSVEVAHWLMAKRGKIDDCETSMSQADSPVGREIYTSVIRAAMTDCFAHLFY